MGARGYLTTFAAVIGAALLVPATAAALTLCVNRAGAECQATYNQDQLQTALDFADTQGGVDRILIGAGLYDDGPYVADATNQVEIIGAGPAATILRKAFGNNQTVLTVDHVASTVENLGIEVGNGSNPTGLSVRNSASNIRVVEVVTATGNKTGVTFTAASGSLVDSNVSLDVNTGTTAVNAVILGSNSQLTLQNNDLQAATGVAYQTPLRAERNRITARFAGIDGTGPLDLESAAIRMVGSGVANPVAVRVASTQMGTPLEGNLQAKHLTAFGTGAGSGVVVGSGCKPSGGNVTGNPAAGQVRDTVIDGFANDLLVAGRQCFDPVLGMNVPSSASMNVDYSLFDPAAKTVLQPATFTSGPNNRTGDPQFVDAGAGNLHLLQTSPAVDAGQPTAAAGNERDVEGNPRVQDGNGDGTAVRDMGAFEHTFVASGGGGGGGDPTPDPGPGPPGPGGQITRTLSLGYKAKTDKFKGALRSNEAGCLAGKVKVFEKQRGKDPKVGSDKTDGAGKWTFKERGADGKFYATIPQKTVPAGTCPAARSKSKRI